VTRADIDLVRDAWTAFARGDIDSAAATLDPEVRWYAADDPEGEGACRNREQATAFMRRSLAEGVTAELLDVQDAGDRLVTVIRTHAPPEWELGPEPHGELVTVRNGKVTEIVVYASVEDARAATNPGSGN
jgi:ketosteroid isomerase-like protein